MAHLAFVQVSANLLLQGLGLSQALVSPDTVRLLIDAPELDDVPEGAAIPEITVTVHTRPAEHLISEVCRVDATYPDGHSVKLEDHSVSPLLALHQYEHRADPAN